MTVNGEAGALLFVDGKASGRLPLSAPLSLSAGAHRFRIDVRGSRYQSDVLMIPSGRVVELSLTRGTKGTAIAVLTLTPMILLQVRGGGIDDSLRLALWRASQEGARAEHAVLVPPERQQALAPRDCQADVDCQLSSAQSVDARFVLAVELPGLASPRDGHPAADSQSQRCGLRGEILDVSTTQRAAAAEASPPCVSGEDQLLESLVRLVRQLVSAATHHGRGSLSVRTTPSGAKISVAGRLRGTTPWAGPCLAGKHPLVVEMDGFERFETSVDIPAAQLTNVPIELVPIPPPVAPPEPPPAPPVVAPPPPVAAPVEVPKAPAVRPRWRLISGGALIGAGVLLGGFGVSALSQDGGCADIPVRTSGVCNEVYSTVGIGGSLLGFGIALSTGGALLMAWPPPASSATTRGVR